MSGGEREWTGELVGHYRDREGDGYLVRTTETTSDTLPLDMPVPVVIRERRAAPREGHAVGWSEDAPAMSETERAREALVAARYLFLETPRHGDAQRAYATVRAALGATPEALRRLGKIVSDLRPKVPAGRSLILDEIEAVMAFLRSPSLPVAPSEEWKQATADIGIGGIYDIFHDAPDAIRQLGHYIQECRRATGCPEDRDLIEWLSETVPTPVAPSELVVRDPFNYAGAIKASAAPTASGRTDPVAPSEEQRIEGVAFKDGDAFCNGRAPERCQESYVFVP